MNAGCLVWNVILDYIANNTEDQESPQTEAIEDADRPKFWAERAEDADVVKIPLLLSFGSVLM